MTDQVAVAIKRTNPPELGVPPGYSQVVEVRGGRIIFIGCAQYYGKGKTPPPVVTKGYAKVGGNEGTGHRAGPFFFSPDASP